MTRSAAPGRISVLILFAAFCCACGSDEPVEPAANVQADAAIQVKALADEYVVAMLDRYPETRTYYGLAGPQDRFYDNSLDALKRWHVREDIWLKRLRDLQPVMTLSNPQWATFGLLRGT